MKVLCMVNKELPVILEIKEKDIYKLTIGSICDSCPAREEEICSRDEITDKK